MAAVILIDPTLFVDNMFSFSEDARYEHINLTGMTDLSKLALYTAVLDNLDSEAIRYGHMLNENTIVMDADSLTDYLEELTQSIMDMTGISEIEEAEGTKSAVDEAYNEYMFGVFGESVLDESEAFRQAEDEGLVEELDVYSIINDFLVSCIDDSIRVVTGGYREIEHNIIVI